MIQHHIEQHAYTDGMRTIDQIAQIGFVTEAPIHDRVIEREIPVIGIVTKILPCARNPTSDLLKNGRY
ncbi:hypothetical protein UUC_13188 [Rhodanobacter denitrificans]|nr:hypothetical protein UUC_13188 [Rhodanobacter denitrificans]